MKRTKRNLEKKNNLFLFLPCISSTVISVRKIFVLLDLTWKHLIYHLIGTSFIFAADIEECTASPSACLSDAKCTNTVGSYCCACNPGYTGNGKTYVGKYIKESNVFRKEISDKCKVTYFLRAPLWHAKIIHSNESHKKTTTTTTTTKDKYIISKRKFVREGAYLELSRTRKSNHFQNHPPVLCFSVTFRY